jgi:hypothetical protein
MENKACEANFVVGIFESGMCFAVLVSCAVIAAAGVDLGVELPA